MSELHLSHNKLTGEIELTQLPYRLNNLQLQCNQLTGDIDLTHLLDAMYALHLQNNQLSGSTPFCEPLIWWVHWILKMRTILKQVHWGIQNDRI